MEKWESVKLSSKPDIVASPEDSKPVFLNTGSDPTSRVAPDPNVLVTGSEWRRNDSGGGGGGRLGFGLGFASSSETYIWTNEYYLVIKRLADLQQILFSINVN